MKKMILALTLFCAAQANATVKHMFYCELTQNEPYKQVYFEIDESDLGSGKGTLRVSQLGGAPRNVQWHTIEQAEVQAKLTWGQERSAPVITAIDVDMGRSGKVQAAVADDGSGFVKATLMSLNYPQGVKATFCTYLRSPGDRPIMTGSN